MCDFRKQAVKLEILRCSLTLVWLQNINNSTASFNVVILSWIFLVQAIFWVVFEVKTVFPCNKIGMKID